MQQYASVAPLFFTANAGGSDADAALTAFVYNTLTTFADINFYVPLTC